MFSRRWRLRASAAGLLSLGMVASVSVPGAAAPATSPPAPSSSQAGAPGSGTGLPIARTQVTLITGDVVTVGIGADRKVTASVSEAAYRPGQPPPSFLQVSDGDAFHVYPSDAIGLVKAGKLDARLFDVNYLASNGYDDPTSSDVPLILQYREPNEATRDARRTVRDVAAEVDALPGTARPRALRSINAAATKVERKKAGEFWNALVGSTGGRAIDRGMSRVWLDAKVSGDLDVSVPQIGAPAAWQAGLDGTGVKVAVLDSGADLDHPDLAGKIVAAQSFSPWEPDAQDRHGHGTHVATTIAGTGVASGGKYKGVAPGAELMIGKVLGANGSGATSWVLAGMEWAAAGGADIVNMSLGDRDTPGLDPLEQAVADLSARYGTLFVISAGNLGGPDRTIGTPGTAPEALTVAAVDKRDKMASFSSRGPTVDYGFKPDIAAPGVDIVAGRAAGTALGTPVNDRYTSASGTSMAAPQVAGAAAILAQQHPDWTGARLKAVLTGTTVDTPAAVLEEGAGRVDVARAVSQRVSGSGNIDFGRVAYPHGTAVSRTLTYTNDGDAPVTLDLAASFDSRVGPAPAGVLRLDRSSVRVPARGSATVGITLDFRNGPDTWYSGIITATGADGISVRTAVGAFKEPKRGKLTIRTIAAPQMTNLTFGVFGALRVDDRADLDRAYQFNGAPEVTLDVMSGRFSVQGTVGWYTPDGNWNALPVSAPEVAVDGDTTVTLDLRPATALAVRTPKPTDAYQVRGGQQRTSVDGRAMGTITATLPYGGRLWSLPTAKATTGTFHTASQYLLGVPPVSVSADGRPLDARYVDVDPTNGMFDGERKLTVVAAGHGTPEDLAKVDVKGKLVLLDFSDLCPTPACGWQAPPRVAAAHEAGAAAVAFHGTTERATMRWGALDGHAHIPLLNLPPTQARALAAAAAKRPVTVTASGVASSPYIYSLKFYQRQQVPARPDLSVDQRNLVERESERYMAKPGYYKSQFSAVLGGGHDLTNTDLDIFTASQRTRTEYFGPVDADVIWDTMEWPYEISFNPQKVAWGDQQETLNRYTRPGRHVQRWGRQPFTPGVTGLTLDQRFPGITQCDDCRVGDILAPVHLLRNGDGVFGGRTWEAVGVPTSSTEDLRLFQGGREIAMTPYPYIVFVFLNWLPAFPISAEPATYRMTSSFRGDPRVDHYGRNIDTEWTFRTRRADPGTQAGPCLVTVYSPQLGPCTPQRKLFLNYDVDLALDNTARAGRAQVITVSGYGESYTDPDARLTSLTAEVSYDSGTTWHRAKAVKVNGAGDYKLIIKHPILDRTDGTVSLRVDATDNQGNTIKQTIKQAYGLR
ncbi:S8 family serine peptidase [Micromonospora sp. NPDC048170]|uniref:S8 family peptidase n=1 Tax=Micromonospora sp. NPDC048170 TaxID=3154819 RepID=UPI0033EEE077